MKRLLMTLGVFGLMVGAATVSLTAETIKATVPFDFQLRGKTMPAGEYIVTKKAAGGLYALWSREHDGYVSFTGSPAYPTKVTTEPKLVFSVQGDQYALREVWMGGEGPGSKVIRSKDEKQLITKAPQKTVILAAHK